MSWVSRQLLLQVSHLTNAVGYTKTNILPLKIVILRESMILLIESSKWAKPNYIIRLRQCLSFGGDMEWQLGMAIGKVFWSQNVVSCSWCTDQCLLYDHLCFVCFSLYTWHFTIRKLKNTIAITKAYSKYIRN